MAIWEMSWQLRQFALVGGDCFIVVCLTLSHEAQMLSHSCERHLKALAKPGGMWHFTQLTLACAERCQLALAASIAWHEVQNEFVNVSCRGMKIARKTTATTPTVTRAAMIRERRRDRLGGSALPAPSTALTRTSPL